MIPEPFTPVSLAARAPASLAADPRLRDAAERLEASFLAEMLKSAGLGKVSEGFGGGIGEDQFGSFLVEAQALELARAGGIGLAESLFEALKEVADGNSV